MKELPAHVTMIRRRGKYAALRMTPFRSPAIQTAPNGPWEPLAVVEATRRLPWRLRFRLADGTSIAFGVCDPGEVELSRVGQETGGGSSSLGDDPISGIIAIFMLLFYLVMLPYTIVVLYRRSRRAKALRRQFEFSELSQSEPVFG